MSDALSNRGKAKEDSYFDKKNKEALERMKKKQDDEKPRLSPISGEPMEQVVLHGVVIDRCNTSGGIWLDAGELEELAEAMKQAESESGSSGIGNFFKTLGGSS